MNDTIALLLLLLFLTHLAGFTVLGLKRREWYYLALVTTFGLLSASFATLLLAPEIQLGDLALHRLLRFAAWASAAISISWTAARMLRKAQKPR